MRALVYTATEQSEIRDVPEPQAADDMVIVRVSHCGICGSDLHAWHGKDERRIPPLVLGHEAAGVVETGKLAGTRVAINPLMTCGRCAVCKSGDEHLCAERELIGMRVPGAFAERVAVRERNLYAISDGLSFEDAALAEPLAVAVHAVEIAQIQLPNPIGDVRIAILGGGAIGLLCALVLQHRGATALNIAETNAGRRALLSQCLDAAVYDPLSKLIPASGSMDLVIDAVGSGATRRAASSLVAPGGVIIHIGLQDNAEGLDTRRLTLQEISFTGTYCYRDADFRAALQLLESKAITGAPWAQVRPLGEGARAFLDMHNGNAAPKIVLDMNA